MQRVENRGIILPTALVGAFAAASVSGLASSIFRAFRQAPRPWEAAIYSYAPIGGALIGGCLAPTWERHYVKEPTTFPSFFHMINAVGLPLFMATKLGLTSSKPLSLRQFAALSALLASSNLSIGLSFLLAVWWRLESRRCFVPGPGRLESTPQPEPQDTSTSHAKSDSEDLTDKLPAELWHSIILRLHPRDAKSMRRVSRTFNNFFLTYPRLMVRAQTTLEMWTPARPPMYLGSVGNHSILFFRESGVKDLLNRNFVRIQAWSASKKMGEPTKITQRTHIEAINLSTFTEGTFLQIKLDLFHPNRFRILAHDDQPVIVGPWGNRGEFFSLTEFVGAVWGSSIVWRQQVPGGIGYQINSRSLNSPPITSHLTRKDCNAQVFSVLQVAEETMLFCGISDGKIDVYTMGTPLQVWCSLSCKSLSPAVSTWHGESTQGLATGEHDNIDIWDAADLKKGEHHPPSRSISLSRSNIQAISSVTLPNGIPLLIAGGGSKKNAWLSIVNPIIGKEIALFSLTHPPQKILPFVLEDRLIVQTAPEKRDYRPTNVITINLRPLLDATTPASAEPDSPPSQSPSGASDQAVGHGQDGKG